MENVKTNWKICIGMNDKDAHKQLIPADVFAGRVGHFFSEGCSILQGVGYYHGEAEASLFVDIYGYTVAEVKAACAALCDGLNQNEIAALDYKTGESYFFHGSGFHEISEGK